MCLGGGIYSLGESGFKEVKPKMQKVVKWNKFEQSPAPSAQRAVTCHDPVHKIGCGSNGICLGHVDIIGDRVSHKECLEMIEVNVDSGAIDKVNEDVRQWRLLHIS